MARFNNNGGECLDDCLIVQAIAGLSVGMVLMNPPGKVMWLNRAAEQVLGTSASRCVGRQISRFLKDPQLATFWHESARRNGIILGEVSVRWPRSIELKVSATW